MFNFFSCAVSPHCWIIYSSMKMGYSTQPMVWCLHFLAKCFSFEVQCLHFMKFQPNQEHTKQMFWKRQVKWTSPTEFGVIPLGFFFHSSPTQPYSEHCLLDIYDKEVFYIHILWCLCWHCWGNTFWLRTKSFWLRTKRLGPPPKSMFLMDTSRV